MQWVARQGLWAQASLYESRLEVPANPCPVLIPLCHGWAMVEVDVSYLYATLHASPFSLLKWIVVAKNPVNYRTM
jgi:hypothetical protein